MSGEILEYLETISENQETLIAKQEYTTNSILIIAVLLALIVLYHFVERCIKA